MAAKGKPTTEYTDMDKLLARAKPFDVGGHSYRVLPLLIADALVYAQEYPWAYSPMYLITDEEGRKLLERWLEKAVRTDKGEVVTFETINSDGWTTADVIDCLKELGGVSG